MLSTYISKRHGNEPVLLSSSNRVYFIIEDLYQLEGFERGAKHGTSNAVWDSEACFKKANIEGVSTVFS